MIRLRRAPGMQQIDGRLMELRAFATLTTEMDWASAKPWYANWRTLRSRIRDAPMNTAPLAIANSGLRSTRDEPPGSRGLGCRDLYNLAEEGGPC
jgi:hypothetical protein